MLSTTVSEFQDDNTTRPDWAAALTYYAVHLSIFPALLVLVSVLGLVGQSATQPLIDNVSTLAPGPAQDIFTDAIRNLQRSRAPRASCSSSDSPPLCGRRRGTWQRSCGPPTRSTTSRRGRPITKTLPVRVGLTLALLVLLGISAIGVVLTGGLAEKVGDVVGVGGTAVDVWGYAKWPVLLLIMSFLFALLYWAARNVKQSGFRWISPGGLLAVIGWVIGSLVFAFYVANFGSYNKTYGALGGVIIFLLWLWISNIMVLLGAEFNAELERGRAIERGMRPEDKEPFMEPRDAKKTEDDDGE